MNYHTTINGNQREVKSQNPVYWIGVTPHVPKSKKNNSKVYRMMRENGGCEEFKMIEIEKFPCNDKREAEKRESEVMKELKS